MAGPGSSIVQRLRARQDLPLAPEGVSAESFGPLGFATTSAAPGRMGDSLGAGRTSQREPRQSVPADGAYAVEILGHAILRANLTGYIHTIESKNTKTR